MQIKLSSLFFSIFLFWNYCYNNVTTATDYCEKSLCRDSVHHIGCHNDGAIASKCVNHSKFISLKSIKDVIVDQHNKYRNQIALGQIQGFETAIRMGTMQWDDELELLASYNVKTCKFELSKCYNTERFKYSGQNIAYFASTDLPEPKIILTNLINNWFEEHEHANMSLIRKYRETHRTIGHFTIMIIDSNIRVGCASLKHADKSFDEVITACNYARINLVSLPIYKDGPVASKCVKGINPKYKGLCHPDEKIDPNNVINKN